MAQQRLPTVNSDDGLWGDILNQFLQKEHYNTAADNPLNGGHQKITIRPGSTVAGSAPLKFLSGALLSAPETGSIEFLTDKLYFTQTSGTIRKTIASYDDTAGATGDMYYKDSLGNFTRLAVGASSQVLTVSSGLPTWQTTSAGVSNLDGGVASSLFGGAATINGGTA